MSSPSAPWRRSFSDSAWSLPAHRQVITGQTFSSTWDAATTGPGASIERPFPKRNRRAKDLAFGLAMAIVVIATLAVLWKYGSVRA